MAKIKQKNTHRCRVQFSMSYELHQSYKSIIARASQLNVVIDFANDFEEWFANQLGQVEEKFNQIEVKDPFLIEPNQKTENTNVAKIGIHQEFGSVHE